MPILDTFVMLNLVNFVQFAYARHSSSRLDSALAQSQISASHREPCLVLVRGQILKQVQDDFCAFMMTGSVYVSLCHAELVSVSG